MLKRCALSLVSCCLFAQNSTQGNAGTRFLKDICKDQKTIWTSSFRMNKKQLLTVALPVAGLAAALFATDARITGALPNTPDQVRWSQRVSELGALYTLGTGIGLSFAAGKATGNENLVSSSRAATEALVDATIVSYALKHTLARERTNMNDGQGRFWKGGDSFPSGHAMSAWAVATAIARRPNRPKWAAVVS
jgi:hypothetical protein